MSKKRKEVTVEMIPPELEMDPELEVKVQKMIENAKQDAPNFWEGGISKHLYVPVDDGELRVLYIKPKNAVSRRPIVFIPGWGGIFEGYQDFYRMLHDRSEFYFIETREKSSRKLNRKKAKMTISQKAKDIQDVINHLKINEEDFVLFGTCWGGSIVLQGLIEGSIKAPTILTHDPMHSLWFPRWFLKYFAPFLPLFVVEIIKPILIKLKLRGMKEEVQRKRAEAFIANAEVWKWKRASMSVKDFELYGNLSKIKEEVFVNNGTQDKVHNKEDYPKITKE
ncbi:MAG: alpha/beta hydrolase, partial [Candidatus Heimdallarchaeota archaeon]|nr:alpha/beta hydrolase [Candidatus Heimdallarchaeota archaeon]